MRGTEHRDQPAIAQRQSVDHRHRGAASVRLLLAAGLTGLLLLAGCGHPNAAQTLPTPSTPAVHVPTVPPVARVPWPFRHQLPGMPPVIGNDVYSQTRAGMMRSDVAREPGYLYVPDSTGSTVTVISQRSRRIVRVIRAGSLSQHVVPAYGLDRLYVTSSVSNELVAINPRTGQRTFTRAVPRPYNLYFTPDGKAAIVMVEQHNVIRFSNPRTFAPIKDVSSAGCSGPNHADFSANGRFFVVTCEFSGELLKVSTLGRRVIGRLHLNTHQSGQMQGGMGRSMPQDVRLSPDGTTFYVADMGTDELRLISARTFRQIGVLRMPSHPHGIYPSRDGRFLYVSDRGAGKVSVVNPKTRRIVATWTIPGGGSPDMGGVSADGSMLWLSGRYDGVVYGFATRTGRLVAKIRVGGSPHGLAVWPQPGRYSLGHTGDMR